MRGIGLAAAEVGELGAHRGEDARGGLNLALEAVEAGGPVAAIDLLGELLVQRTTRRHDGISTV